MTVILKGVDRMARRKGNKGLLLAGLAAGAYAYFKKPENREKATVAFNNAKEKVNCKTVKMLPRKLTEKQMLPICAKTK